MRRKNKKTKKRLGMGTGEGSKYKPYIQVGEFGSMGTAACVVDYKTGRNAHLLSQAEVIAWYLLRWDDENIDIREQYPLPEGETYKIAKLYGLKHPATDKGLQPLTTDLLVKRKSGDFAISIKASKNIKNPTNLFIEQQYWKSKGIEWKLIFKDELNVVKYRNIRNIVAHYNDIYFPDEITFLKFLLARKLVKTDMEVQIDYEKLLIEKRKELEKWKSEELKLVTNI